MRYCHHCGAEVGPQAEVCDECDGDLFEPPEDLRADLDEVADADDAEAAEDADAESAAVEDGEPDVDAAAADGAAADDVDDEAEDGADDEADAATDDDGDAGHGRVDSLFSSDESTADASDDEQGFVAKIKGLFQ